MPDKSYFANTQAFRAIAYEICWVTGCKSIATTSWKGPVTHKDTNTTVESTFPVCGHHKKLLEEPVAK